MTSVPPSHPTSDNPDPTTPAPKEMQESGGEGDVGVTLEDDGSRIWTAEEQFILHDSVKGYRKTPRKEKLNFVRLVAGKIKKLFATKVGGEDNLRPGKSHYNAWQVKKDQQVFGWMTKHARTTRTLKLPGMNQKFNFLKVFTEMKKAEIIKEARQLAAAAGNPKYIGYYQKARNNIRMKLTDEELEEYSKTAHKWNAGEVPPDIQILYADKYSKRVLDEMNKRNFLTMGMRSIILECHMGPKKKIIYSLTDSHALHLDDPRIPSFNRYNPSAAHVMTQAYAEYVNHVIGILDNTILLLPTEVFEEKMLTYHPGGHPKIPDGLYNKQGNESNRMQQGMIRVYLNKLWQRGGGTGGSVQWTRVSETPYVFFNSGDMPPGVVIQDPGKYKAFQTIKILDFWRAKQAKGEIPFTFLNVIVGSTVSIAQYPVGFHDGVAPTGPPPPRPIKRHARSSRHRVLSDSEPENVPSDAEGDLAAAVDQPVLQPTLPLVPTPSPSVEPVVPTVSTPPLSIADSTSMTGIVDIPDEGPYHSQRLFRQARHDGTPTVGNKSVDDLSAGDNDPKALSASPNTDPPTVPLADKNPRNALLANTNAHNVPSADPMNPPDVQSAGPSRVPIDVPRPSSPVIRQTRSRAALQEPLSVIPEGPKLKKSKSKRGGKSKK